MALWVEIQSASHGNTSACGNATDNQRKYEMELGREKETEFGKNEIKMNRRR